MASYPTLNPFDGRDLRTVELMSAVAVEQRLAAAQAAFPAWSGLPLEQRGVLLRQVAAALRTRRDEIQRTMTREMGKLRGEALAEIEKSAAACEYYADHAAGIITSMQPATMPLRDSGRVMRTNACHGLAPRS